MPQLAALFFVAMVALLGAMHIPGQIAQSENAVAHAGSTSFLAYRESVIDYLNANPGFSGSVPDASLTFLWGYQRDGRWSNVVAGGALYVFEVTAGVPGNSLMIDRLYSMTNSSFMVGRNSGGSLISAKGFSTGIPVPLSVPDGALLIVGK